MNSTIVLNRLTAARAEGGNTHAITAATALVNQYYPGRTFDVETPVNAVFNALDRFDRAAAETAINDALATLARPVPVAAVAADTAVAEDTTNHEARLAALEGIARSNGYGYALAPATATIEARLTAVEAIARRANLS